MTFNSSRNFRQNNRKSYSHSRSHSKGSYHNGGPETSVSGSGGAQSESVPKSVSSASSASSVGSTGSAGPTGATGSAKGGWAAAAARGVPKSSSGERRASENAQMSKTVEAFNSDEVRRYLAQRYEAFKSKANARGDVRIYRPSDGSWGKISGKSKSKVEVDPNMSVLNQLSKS